MRHCLTIFSFCFLASLGIQTAFPGPLGTIAVVGDSLSAGFQNYSLYTSETKPGLPPGGQEHGFAQLIAQQAGTDLHNPTVSYPGLPPLLRIDDAEKISRVSEFGIGTRTDTSSSIQTLNLSVPSYRVADANGRQANTNPTNLQDVLELTVLGPPSYCGALDFPTATVTLSSAACAVQLKPQTILVSIGANDALLSLLVGPPLLPTSKDAFKASYHQLMTTLQQANARMIVANVPDITLLPYVWTQQNFLARCKYLPKTDSATDYVVPNFADPMSSGDVCTSYAPRSANLVEQAKSAIKDYNKIIKDEAHDANAVVLDLNKLFADMNKKGVDVGDKHLTTAFLGGLFSLDGMHTTNTGNGIIANEAINAINKAWKLSIPPVCLEAIAATDPLVPSNY